MDSSIYRIISYSFSELVAGTTWPCTNTFTHLATSHSGSGGGLGTGGLALAYQCRQSGRVRACVESVLVHGLMKKLKPLLVAEDLELAFTKVVI